MMQRLGEYVLSLTAAAVLCSLMLTLARGGAGRELVRTVCGVILAVTALSPLKTLKIPDFQDYFEDFAVQGDALSAMGVNMAAGAASADITRALNAYILDKAAALGARIHCEIQLNGQGYPTGAAIYGEVTSGQRQALSRILRDELGIAKENQQWIG